MGDQIGFGQGREIDQAYATVEPIHNPPAQLHREPGLPAATRTCQRDQLRLFEQNF